MNNSCFQSSTCTGRTCFYQTWCQLQPDFGHILAVHLKSVPRYSTLTNQSLCKSLKASSLERDVRNRWPTDALLTIMEKFSQPWQGLNPEPLDWLSDALLTELCRSMVKFNYEKRGKRRKCKIKIRSFQQTRQIQVNETMIVIHFIQ